MTPVKITINKDERTPEQLAQHKAACVAKGAGAFEFPVPWSVQCVKVWFEHHKITHVMIHDGENGTGFEAHELYSLDPDVKALVNKHVRLNGFSAEMQLV